MRETPSARCVGVRSAEKFSYTLLPASLIPKKLSMAASVADLTRTK